MSLLGAGAVAIWHDIVPEGRSEFYAWHGGEHMPERAGIPGFLRGRRFIAFDADLEFFNLYETRDASVVKGDDYRARLNNPTPWTLSSVQHFRAVARSLTQVAYTAGTSDGGLLATLRYTVAEADEAEHVSAMTRDILPKLAKEAGIAAVAMLIADLEASGEVNAEQRARGGRNETPRHALLVEGWGDQEQFVTTLRSDAMNARLAGAGVPNPAGFGFYQHQITLPAQPRA
jgi:hypothetical protein